MQLFGSLAGGSNFDGLAMLLVVRGSTGIHFCTAALKTSTQYTGYEDSLKRFLTGVAWKQHRYELHANETEVWHFRTYRLL